MHLSGNEETVKFLRAATSPWMARAGVCDVGPRVVKRLVGVIGYILSGILSRYISLQLYLASVSSPLRRRPSVGASRCQRPPFRGVANSGFSGCEYLKNKEERRMLPSGALGSYPPPGNCLTWLTATRPKDC